VLTISVIGKSKQTEKRASQLIISLYKKIKEIRTV